MIVRNQIKQRTETFEASVSKVDINTMSRANNFPRSTLAALSVDLPRVNLA